jgi:hypothetical protein
VQELEPQELVANGRPKRLHGAQGEADSFHGAGTTEHGLGSSGLAEEGLSQSTVDLDADHLSEASDGGIGCSVCGSTARASKMLLCDEPDCGKGWHFDVRRGSPRELLPFWPWPAFVDAMQSGLLQTALSCCVCSASV